MDFVVIEIFCLLWFPLTLGTFGEIIEPHPSNQAVSEGTENVTIKCVSTGNPETINWSMTPAGGTVGKIIKNGPEIEDKNAFDGSIDTKDNSFTLTVRKASSSTAGTYACGIENEPYYVLLVVILGEAVCSYSPRDTAQLPCDSTLQLSCTLSYSANTLFIKAALQWSRNKGNDDDPELPWEPKAEDHKEDSSEPGSITTATSPLNVTWPKDRGDIPIYNCTATFATTESVPSLMSTVVPRWTSSCLPFTKAVQCGTEAPKVTDDPKKTIESSARSAETSNLAIQVLGVAGVLLLAQMF